MFELLPTLDTQFGNFKGVMERQAVAPGGPAVPVDILPMSVSAIRNMAGVNEDIRDWAALTVLSLNYYFCCGWEKATSLNHSQELTAAQRKLLEDHIFPGIARMVETNPVIPHIDGIVKDLSRKGMDYDGGSYVVMEDLEVEKVIACWPTKDAAAVQPITRFVTGITKEALEKPSMTILPEEEWPYDIPSSLCGQALRHGRSWLKKDGSEAYFNPVLKRKLSETGEEERF